MATPSSAGRRQMKQVNPITARLRDILRNYSSAQVLNELLQNADDAGSSKFKVLVDGLDAAGAVTGSDTTWEDEIIAAQRCVRQQCAPKL